MVKTKKSKRKAAPKELDSVYVLKLALYMVLGAQWLRITKGGMQIPIPIGLILGLLFASHEHFRIDRKMEYALLLIVTFIAFWLPIGLEIAIK